MKQCTNIGIFRSRYNTMIQCSCYCSLQRMLYLIPIWLNAGEFDVVRNQSLIKRRIYTDLRLWFPQVGWLLPIGQESQGHLQNKSNVLTCDPHSNQNLHDWQIVNRIKLYWKWNQDISSSSGNITLDSLTSNNGTCQKCFQFFGISCFFRRHHFQHVHFSNKNAEFKIRISYSAWHFFAQFNSFYYQLKHCSHPCAVHLYCNFCIVFCEMFWRSRHRISFIKQIIITITLEHQYATCTDISHYNYAYTRVRYLKKNKTSSWTLLKIPLTVHTCIYNSFNPRPSYQDDLHLTHKRCTRPAKVYKNNIALDNPD